MFLRFSLAMNNQDITRIGGGGTLSVGEGEMRPIVEASFAPRIS